MKSTENRQASRAEGWGEAPSSVPMYEAECAQPALWLWVGAAIWLLIGSLLGFLAILKFHAPGLLADIPWLTYGRLWPAHWNAWLYGFGVPSAVATMWWLMSRLSRAPLPLAWLCFMGALFWNVGVLIGLLGVLSGLTTGHSWLEMPHYTAPILFVAYALMGIPPVLAFIGRRNRHLYLSVWFCFVALFWFPWIYTSSSLFLGFFEVRGVVQAIITGWYGHNLKVIFFGFVGIALLFYFLPSRAGRPLYSRYEALFIFWMLVLFGSWGGISHGAPVPAWVPSLSTAGFALTVLALLAMAATCHRTLVGQYDLIRTDLPLRFMGLGGMAFLLAWGLEIVSSFRGVDQLVGLTLFGLAQEKLWLYGFAFMMLFGSIYFIAPRLALTSWPFPRGIGLHFWLAVIGFGLYWIALVAGGVAQGVGLNQAGTPFLEVHETTLWFLRVATLGELMILAGHGVFAVNLVRLYWQYAFAEGFETLVQATQSSETAEVRS